MKTLTLLAALVAVLLSTSAVAQTYTGCLTNGYVNRVKFGDAPRRPGRPCERVTLQTGAVVDLISINSDCRRASVRPPGDRFGTVWTRVRTQDEFALGVNENRGTLYVASVGNILQAFALCDLGVKVGESVNLNEVEP